MEKWLNDCFRSDPYLLQNLTLSYIPVEKIVDIIQIPVGLVFIRLSSGEMYLYDKYNTAVRNGIVTSGEDVFVHLKNFGWRVFRILCLRHVYQNELCKKLGISESRFSNYMSNRRKIPAELLVKMSEILKVPPSAFYMYPGWLETD